MMKKMSLLREYGKCVFKNVQNVTLQEMPENAPAGQLPRSVQVVIEGDLVGACKPGDRVQIIGEYKALPNKKGVLLLL